MKHFSYSYNDYLSKCDSINKNSLKHFKFSKIKSITLDISLSSMLELINNSKNTISKLDNKMFFILYLYQFLKPFIKIKHNTNMSLKLKISNTYEVNKFLSFFFLYINSNLYFKHFLYINKLNNIDNFNFKVPIFFIPGLNELTNLFFQTLDLKNFYCNIYFMFENKNSSYHFINYIQNYMGFWMIKKN